MRFTKQKLALIFIAASLVLTPSLAAARGLVPCGGYSDNNNTREKPCTVSDIFVLIAQVTNWMIGVAGIYAVYKLVNVGWSFTTTLGNEEKITQLKSTITDTVVGLVLVMMAFMLVNFVVNILLTRDLVTTNNTSCKLDLTNPLTYLKIDPSKCSSQPDQTLH